MIDAFLLEWKKKKFIWGEADCALFICDYLERIKGIDYSADYKGKYKNEIGASKQLKKNGYDNLKALADAKLKPIKPLFAQRGDIVMMNNNCIGICTGHNCFFLSMEGLTAYPLSKITYAWKVD